MTLSEGTYEVPSGMVAAIVTHLICEEFIEPRPAPDGVRLVRDERPEVGAYRDLFRMIGRDWLWTSRLMLADEDLHLILSNPMVDLHILESNAGSVGIAELDFRIADDPQLAFFGLAPALIGRGIGSWMMAEIQGKAAERGAATLRINTCTLDAPWALRFYLGHGFRAKRREVQLFPDPRGRGLLDRAAAPWVPIL